MAISLRTTFVAMAIFDELAIIALMVDFVEMGCVARPFYFWEKVMVFFGFAMDFECCRVSYAWLEKKQIQILLLCFEVLHHVQKTVDLFGLMAFDFSLF